MNTVFARLTPPSVERRPQRTAICAAQIRPSTLDSITQVIGAAAATSLVAEFGGRRLYVPHTQHPDDALTRILGAGAAAALTRFFGGERIVVPADFDRAHRRERIIEARRKGLSISAVARETGCTERYVYKVLAQARQG